MTYLRKAVPEDIPIVNGWWEKHHSASYSVPSRNNVIDDVVMISGGRPVGYGMVRLFAEVITILDNDAPITARTKGVVVGMNYALDVTRRAGLEQLHVFTTDPHFSQILQKHWGYRVAQGTVLFREI